jgi:peptidase E
MNDRKPVYLLAGRGGGGNDLIIRAVLDDISHRSPTIAYLGAASEDNPEFFARMAALISGAGDCKVVQVLTYAGNADIGRARDVLEAADAIFVSGGDVDTGMRVLEEKGIAGIFCGLWDRGKVFFGVSAGSIMMAKEWVRWRDPDDDATAELFPCLGVAPVLCDTHGEGEGWEELKAALRLKPAGAFGYGIATGTCLKVLPDGRVESLGGPVFRYVRTAKTVRRQADLVP